MNSKQARRLRKIAKAQPDLQEDLLVRGDKGVVRLIPDCPRKQYHILKDMFLACPTSGRNKFITVWDSL